MADQDYQENHKLFWLDLHKVSTSDARKALQSRLKECCQYGIPNLFVVYGTPDSYRGSIAEALRKILDTSYLISPAELPTAFWENPESYTAKNGAIRIPLSKPITAGRKAPVIKFSPFEAEYETDPWLRSHCENWFYPYKEWYQATEVASRLPGKVTLTDVAAATSDLPDDFVKRDASGNCVAVHRDAMPSLVRNWACSPTLNRTAQRPESADPHSDVRSPSAAREIPWRVLIERSISYIEKGEYELASAALFKAYEQAMRDGKWSYLFITLSNLGYLSEMTADGLKAIDYYAKALLLLTENAPNDSQRISATKFSLVKAFELSGVVSDSYLKLVQELNEDGELDCSFDHLSTALALEKVNREKAQDIYEKIVEKSETSQSINYNLVSALLRLAEMKYEYGEYSEGYTCAEKGLLYVKNILPETHAYTVSFRMLCGLCLRYLGMYEEAAAHFDSIIQLAGLSDGSEVAFARVHLGVCLRSLGRQEEARICYSKVIESEESGDSGLSYVLGLAHLDLGVLYRDLGQLDKAEDHYEIAHRVFAEVSGNKSRECAAALANHAKTLMWRGRLAEAEAMLERSVATYRLLLPALHPDLANVLATFGNLRKLQNRYCEARKCLVEALQIREVALGHSHVSTARVKVLLGMLEVETGDKEKGQELLAEGEKTLRSNGTGVRLDPAQLEWWKDKVQER